MQVRNAETYQAFNVTDATLFIDTSRSSLTKQPSAEAQRMKQEGQEYEKSPSFASPLGILNYFSDERLRVMPAHPQTTCFTVLWLAVGVQQDQHPFHLILLGTFRWCK